MLANLSHPSLTAVDRPAGHAWHARCGDRVAEPVTIAYGLKEPAGDLIWHFVRQHVKEVLSISEKEIAGAMQLIWKRLTPSPASGEA